MRALLALTALIVAAPAVTHAQDATERRRQQTIDNLRQMEQNQRLGDVERQLNDMELRRQSAEALRALQGQPPISPAPYIVPGSRTGLEAIQPLQTPALPAVDLSSVAPVGIAITPDDRMRDLELAASNARLKEIAAAQRGQ